MASINETNHNNQLDLKIILLSAIGYTIAMTWSDLITKSSDKFFGITESTPFSRKALLAALLTFILLIIGYFLFWFFRKERTIYRNL